MIYIVLYCVVGLGFSIYRGISYFKEKTQSELTIAITLGSAYVSILLYAGLIKALGLV